MMQIKDAAEIGQLQHCILDLHESHSLQTVSRRWACAGHQQAAQLTYDNTPLKESREVCPGHNSC